LLQSECHFLHITLNFKELPGTEDYGVNTQSSKLTSPANKYISKK
jgi:hypothetical protein